VRTVINWLPRPAPNYARHTQLSCSEPSASEACRVGGTPTRLLAREHGSVRTGLRQVEPSVSEVGSGWYLDRIEVMGPEGTQSSFPCHNWLGKSDAGDHRGARAPRCPAAWPAFMPCLQARASPSQACRGVFPDMRMHAQALSCGPHHAWCQACLRTEDVTSGVQQLLPGAWPAELAAGAGPAGRAR
jgi:hypothetical protein